MTKIKVLSLNCWGLPWTSKYRNRISSLITDLPKSESDIVILQEIIIQKDIDSLTCSLNQAYPYYHYFYGGMVGTGVIILSKFKIINVASFPFNQSGMIYHMGGDWFACKSLCYAIVSHPEKDIHIFGSHTHAKYPRNEFNELRTFQLFQIANTIKLLTRENDAVILAGDLNTESYETVFKFLLNFCSLKDSCFEIHSQNSNTMYTWNAPGNSYSTTTENPNRIDYILYNGYFSVESFKLSFEKIEGEDISYSDHTGIEAIFELNNEKKFKEEIDKNLLHDVHAIIMQGQKESVFPVYYSTLIMVMIMVPLFLLSFVDLGIFGRVIIMTGFGIFTLSIILYLTFFISLRQQRRAFKNASHEIKILKDLI